MNTSKYNNIQIRKPLSTLLSLSCLIIVLYQTKKCIQKFSSIPKTTEVSIEKASDNVNPDITICNMKFAEILAKLEKCNTSVDLYQLNQVWSGQGDSNCTNPENVFLNTVHTPTEIIRSIDVTNFDNDKFKLNLKPSDSQNVHSSHLYEQLMG